MLAFALAKTTPWTAPAGSVLPALLLVGWVVSPFGPLLVAASRSRSKGGAAVVLALGIAATLIGASVYADAFLRHDSPAYALLFLSVPVIQWGIGAVALAAAAVLDQRAGSR